MKEEESIEEKISEVVNQAHPDDEKLAEKIFSREEPDDLVSKEVKTFSGRIWLGILESRIMVPPEGWDYLFLSGDLKTVMELCIGRAEEEGLFLWKVWILW